jgi:hypothetical protein
LPDLPPDYEDLDMALHIGDKRAAFIGMIVTAAALFVMAFTIVKLTNAKFAGHKAEAKAGETK